MLDELAMEMLDVEDLTPTEDAAVNLDVEGDTSGEN